MTVQNTQAIFPSCDRQYVIVVS